MDSKPAHVVVKDYHYYKQCIDACLLCASTCQHCASSCLHEEDVKMMSSCIQHDLECSVMCYAAAQLMSLGSELSKEMCKDCAIACRASAAICGKHTHFPHCVECAAACIKCAEACEKMAA